MAGTEEGNLAGNLYAACILMAATIANESAATSSAGDTGQVASSGPSSGAGTESSDTSAGDTGPGPGPSGPAAITGVGGPPRPSESNPPPPPVSTETNTPPPSTGSNVGDEDDDDDDDDDKPNQRNQSTSARQNQPQQQSQQNQQQSNPQAKPSASGGSGDCDIVGLTTGSCLPSSGLPSVIYLPRSTVEIPGKDVSYENPLWCVKTKQPTLRGRLINMSLHTNEGSSSGPETRVAGSELKAEGKDKDVPCGDVTVDADWKQEFKGAAGSGRFDYYSDDYVGVGSKGPLTISVTYSNCRPRQASKTPPKCPTATSRTINSQLGLGGTYHRSSKTADGDALLENVGQQGKWSAAE